jgi:subtilase family serine protease
VKRPAPPSLALLASAALIVGTAGLAPAAVANGNNRTTLPGSVPAWANAAHRASATPSSTPLDFRVYLDWRGGDAAATYATAASTPGNALHGKFLSPAAFNQRFAPTQTTVSQVEGWLMDSGFKVGHVPSNNKYVEATGTAAQAAVAFRTSFAEYTVGGATLRSNTAPLSVPASLTGVEGVIGLDESAALVQHYSNPPAVFNNARPCSSYWGEKTVQNTATLDGTTLPSSPSAFSPCGYAGAQLQGVYCMTRSVSCGNDGSGGRVGGISA